MKKGTVARLMDKGYGFIKVEGDDKQKDVFFHSKNLIDTSFEDLKEGDTLEFDIEDGPKGPNAVNVRRV